jgi:hypothetical protein
MILWATAAELVGHEVQITSRAHHLAAWTGLHGCAIALAPDGRVIVDIVLGRVFCDAAALDVVPVLSHGIRSL